MCLVAKIMLICKKWWKENNLFDTSEVLTETLNKVCGLKQSNSSLKIRMMTMFFHFSGFINQRVYVYICVYIYIKLIFFLAICTIVQVGCEKIPD